MAGIAGSGGPGPLVFAGVATLDTIALVPVLPEPDTRLLAEAITEAGGGPAATAAVAAARLGVPAAFIGAVGDDEAGARILAGLRAENVDVSGVRVMPGRLSAASVVLAERRRQTRAICARPGPPPVIDDAAAGLIRSAAWVHVDHLGWGPAWPVIRDLPRPRRPRVSVDGGNDIDGLVLGAVELYVPTLTALARRYGDRDPGGLLAAGLAEGAANVVATRGGAGCVAAGADGTFAEVPGYRAAVVSTLGAGDVFHGALVAAAARGMPLAEAVRYANAAAALSCAALDGRSAIPSHGDVAALAATPPPGPAGGP
jgi:sulfofructose kinase